MNEEEEVFKKVLRNFFRRYCPRLLNHECMVYEDEKGNLYLQKKNKTSMNGIPYYEFAVISYV